MIALVITIIVLLILAGVTINLTLGENGIFKTAEQAGKNHTQAQEQELAGIANFQNEINNVINGAGNDDTVAEDALASKAKPGDYVRYTPANKTFIMKVDGMSVTENGHTTNYTQAEHGIATGCDEEQTFNTGDYTGLWQVLYNDEEHGLQIISAGDVTNENYLLLAGNSDEEDKKMAYNNVVDTLNGFCSNYVDTRFAISGRCVGSDPINPKDTVTETVTLEFEHNGSYESGCKIGEDNETGKFNLDYNAMVAATNKNTNGINNIGKYYWLASRCVTTDNTGAYFAVRQVSDSGSDTVYLFLGMGWYADFPYMDAGVRPVITLKSGIQTNSGNGSESSPYELVAM